MVALLMRCFIYPLALFLFSGAVSADKTSYRNAVASAHGLASEAGMQILRQGGNAFDAAVTMAMVLAVVEPYSSGLGGGGFWLLQRTGDDKPIMVDGRERAPLAAHRDMYLDSQGSVIEGASMNGALAAGIPGQIAALVHIQEKYGSLPLSRLLQPAILIARNGFPVDEIYRRLLGFRQDVIRQSVEARRIFLVDGDIPATGYLLKQPDLARTLELVAKHGRDGFYAGELAEKLAQGVRDAGGIWSVRDLQEYQVVEREPVQWQWRGLNITSATLPSSGGIVLAQIMNMLDQFEDISLTDTQKIHVLIEAMRRAYRDRAVYMGDSDHVGVNMAELVSRHYASQQASDIDLTQATPSALLDEAANSRGNIMESDNTTHYSIIDSQGNRVSATLSINYPFGSGFVVPGTGVLLNNEMDDFSLRPGIPNAYGLTGGEANAIASGKRMLSSMSPTFVEGQDRLMIIGTPGGSRIITMVLQGILAMYQGMDAAAIVSKPRIHHQYLPDVVQFEPGALKDRQQDELTASGHRLKQLDRPFGNMQLILHDKASGQTSAASDPRGIGVSIVD